MQALRPLGHPSSPLKRQPLPGSLIRGCSSLLLPDLLWCFYTGEFSLAALPLMLLLGIFVLKCRSAFLSPLLKHLHQLQRKGVPLSRCRAGAVLCLWLLPSFNSCFLAPDLYTGLFFINVTFGVLGEPLPLWFSLLRNYCSGWETPSSLSPYHLSKLSCLWTRDEFSRILLPRD